MFEHLVLLIGTNPLPNYVVAEYFLNNNQDLQKIWFVHSEKTGRQEGTIAQAENLEKVLKERHNKRLSFSLHKVALSNVSNAQQILYDINSKLINELSQNCNVHLNYTGGTKVMGTHVYRAIDKEKKISEKSFSYLDGRDFQIVDDKNGIITDDLREQVFITFEELIKLHGFKRKNEDSDLSFSKAVEVFEGLINEGRLDEYFNSYKHTIFESNKKPGELAEKIADLKAELKQFKTDEIFLSVVKAMPAGYQLFNEYGNFINPGSNKHCKYAIKFLDGNWLEDYIYNILANELKNSNITVLKNWEIKKDNWKTNFQLDVILLKGYQLIGISCTTTAEKKDICKNKGFEIIHRIRQIGGEEAKAILVAMLNDDSKRILQEELETDTGGTSANILVVGKNDLKKEHLVKRINDFIE